MATVDDRLQGPDVAAVLRELADSVEHSQDYWTVKVMLKKTAKAKEAVSDVCALDKSQYCHACGVKVPLVGRLGNNKLRKLHACPHGKQCAAGSKTAGLHVNHNINCNECLRRP